MAITPDELNLSQQSTLPPELYAQQQALNRQQQMAQLLMQQGMQQPQGQMVSGRYVPTSFFQNLQPVANMLTGAYLAKQGDTKAAQLAEELRKGKTATEEKIINFMTPQAAVPGQAPVIPQGQTLRDDNGMLTYGAKEGVAGKAATGPDYAAALKEIRTNQYGVGKEYIPTILKQMNPEDTADYKNYLKVKSEYEAKGKPLSFNEYQDIEANRKRPITQNIFGGQQGFENTLKLSDKFTAEPIYKAFQEVKQAHKQVNESLNLNSAVGDVAAATKIAKMLDPTSVVRETELATIANATGLTDRLSQLTERVLTGKTLGPDQRKEFKELSAKFLDVAGNQYNESRNKYLQIGQKNKLEDVETALGAPYKSPSSGWGKATSEGSK